MSRVLVKIAYDGTRFSGYQRQKSDPTVQEELERALAALHDHPVAVTAAGRTDAGVHATGQYISFESDRETIGIAEMPAAMNSKLPTDISALGAWRVHPRFHPRFDAIRRHYRYRLYISVYTIPTLRGLAWRIPEMPDLERLNRDSAAFVGSHDFSTFAARRKDQDNMVRRVDYARWVRRGEEIEFQIGADGFLWHMVRSIVGTVIERERLRLRGKPVGDTIHDLIDARQRSRSGVTAPPWGLYLHDVEYEL